MTGRIRRARTWHILEGLTPRTATSPATAATRCNPHTTYRFDAVSKGGEFEADCKGCLKASWAANPPALLVF